MRQMFQQHSYKRRRKQTHTNLQTVFEAVRRGLIAAVSVLLPSLAKQQSSLVQKQVSLHRLEAGQLLHAGGTPFMADPHTEGSLHQDAAQLTNVTLQSGQRTVHTVHSLFEFIRLQLRMNGHSQTQRTSYPVMAIWCMESLTDLSRSSIAVSASCSSDVPSQSVLYFSSSWKDTRKK